MPPFWLAGDFLDQYMIQIAEEHARAVTLRRTAPVYRIENLITYVIGTRGRSYHNAKVVHEAQCRLLENEGLSVGLDDRGLFGEVSLGLAPSKYALLCLFRSAATTRTRRWCGLGISEADTPLMNFSNVGPKCNVS
jgi:hypothetical protein